LSETLLLSPLQLATAYAVFANGGYLIKPYIVDFVLNVKGKKIYQSAPVVSAQKGDASILNRTVALHVVSSRNVEMINTRLMRRFQRETLDRRTTQDQAMEWAGRLGNDKQGINHWFVGYDDKKVVVVWFGSKTAEKMKSGLRSTVLPIGLNFIRQAEK
jgi:penicillin-binding protein 1A